MAIRRTTEIVAQSRRRVRRSRTGGSASPRTPRPPDGADHRARGARGAPPAGHPIAAPAPWRSPLTLIANAHASGLASPRLVERIAHALSDAGAEVDVALTSSEEEMAERWPLDGRRVVLVGGDGTVHAAANVAPAGAEMAVIPAGRANNVPHSLGIPLEPDATARLAATGIARPLDLSAPPTGTAPRR